MKAPLLAVFLAACASAQLPTSPKQTKLDEEPEIFKREADDDAQAKEESIEEINMKNGIADTLFQGDILLTKEQGDQIAAEVSEVRSKRQAFKEKGWPARKWTDGVPYMFGFHLDDRTKEAFGKAAKLWMENTCINFTEIEMPKTRGVKLPKDYLLVFGGTLEGCKSYVGRKEEPGMQELTLGQGCGTIGHAAHEIGHALGFFHTHTRYDRDKFITVHQSNIRSSWNDQFEMQTIETNNNYDMTYDYGSIMHYAARSSVSIDSERLIMEAIDGNYTETMGSDIISFYDLLMMNTLYNCIDVCEDKNTKCQNDGFPHPRDCSKCICPSGYGGNLCEARPEGCGEELEAKKDWQMIEPKFDGVVAGDDGYKKCNYWIKAPNDENIEVEIVTPPRVFYANDGCKYTGIEIKAHPDKRLTGYRFCSKDDVNKSLVSNSSLVPVIAYARVNLSVNTKLRYRHL